MASILGLGSYLIVNHGDEYWLVRGLYFVVTVVSKVSSFNDTELVWLKRGAFQSVAYRVHWSCFDGEVWNIFGLVINIIWSPDVLQVAGEFDRTKRGVAGEFGSRCKLCFKDYWSKERGSEGYKWGTYDFESLERDQARGERSLNAVSLNTFSFFNNRFSLLLQLEYCWLLGKEADVVQTLIIGIMIFMVLSRVAGSF
ncbi:unnamed protein product, partial [Brassica rapa subsp. trilocularis]